VYIYFWWAFFFEKFLASFWRWSQRGLSSINQSCMNALPINPYSIIQHRTRQTLPRRVRKLLSLALLSFVLCTSALHKSPPSLWASFCDRANNTCSLWGRDKPEIKEKEHRTLHGPPAGRPAWVVVLDHTYHQALAMHIIIFFQSDHLLANKLLTHNRDRYTDTAISRAR
jgi:hypothetical protein